MTANPGQAAGEGFDSATRSIMPDEEVTRLHLLRHGDVERLEERVIRGQIDVSLSDRGRTQSTRLAAWLRAHEARVDRVISSDLSRCRHLGELVARDVGVPLETTERVREQSMGAWEGRTWEDVTREDGSLVTAYWDDYLDARPPSGELMRDVHQRAASWWSDVLAASRGGRIVCVTHVGFIRALTCQLLGFPRDQSLRFAPATASHSSFLVSAAGAVLVTFGERPWLDESDS